MASREYVICTLRASPSGIHKTALGVQITYTLESHGTTITGKLAVLEILRNCLYWHVHTIRTYSVYRLYDVEYYNADLVSNVVLHITNTYQYQYQYISQAPLIIVRFKVCVCVYMYVYVCVCVCRVYVCESIKGVGV